MSNLIHLRPAIPTDLPNLITILITAFAPGPWSTLLFPPSLRTSDDDEFDWRLRITAAQLGRPGHAHVVATAGSAEDDGGGEILGWAHWVDTAAGKHVDESHAAPPKGLDTVALARLRDEAAAVERLARAALGEKWKASWELHYLMIDPAHQRKGIGRVLTQALLDRAVGEERAVWLRSTAEGRGLYLRMGFEEVGEEIVCGERQFAMVKRDVGDLKDTK